MGRSITYHVVGLAREDEYRDRMYPAMSRVEMAQQIAKAHRDGLTIDRWYAQTRRGMTILRVGYILGAYSGYGLSGLVATHALRDAGLLPTLPACVVCDGRGCCCCNYSGITPKGNEQKWEPCNSP